MAENKIIDLEAVLLEMETFKSEVFKSPIIGYSPLPDSDTEVTGAKETRTLRREIVGGGICGLQVGTWLQNNDVILYQTIVNDMTSTNLYRLTKPLLK